MKLKRHIGLWLAAAGMAAALGAAPVAGAEPGGEEPLLPSCEQVGGSSATGGQSTDCATPGNADIVATPNDLGIMGEEADEPMWGMFGW
ncbi:MAG: hypothetical protein FGM52_06310 [Mycobacterium sp.]|nr:hypothetical protein [Mycobacterium sp.]